MKRNLAFMLFLAALSSLAGTSSASSTNGASFAPPSRQEPVATAELAERSEKIRTTCIEGRRYISGRVVQVTAEGLVVDSGYSRLLSPPFNQSWVVPRTASVERDSNVLEAKKPNTLCVGLVFLSNIPKRPAVKNYDYVVIHGYPAGEYNYVPVPGVQKTIRRFSASLERAVQINLDQHKK